MICVLIDIDEQSLKSNENNRYFKTCFFVFLRVYLDYSIHKYYDSIIRKVF